MTDWLEHAERHVLGAILGHSLETPRIWDMVADRLEYDHFTIPQRRTLYAALASAAEEGSGFSMPEVLKALHREAAPTQYHDIAVEMGFCLDFTFPRPSIKTLGSWVDMIRAAYRLRQAKRIAGEFADALHSDDPDQAISTSLEALRRIDSVGREETADDTVARLEEAAKALLGASSEQDGILRTGLIDVDRLFTAGLAPRTMTVLAALTSRGKTALAMQFGDELAGRLIDRSQAGTVRVFSLEMGDLELHKRRLIALSGIPLATWEGRLGTVGEHERRSLEKALQILKRRALRITYGGGITIEQIRATCRKDAAKGGLALVIVDYLQALDASKKDETREREVARMARGLKALAMDLDVPVLALAQLNRAADQAERPTLSHLRESGAIEQYADNVLCLYQRADGTIMFKVLKQRNGDRDKGCPVQFDGPLYTFKNSTKEEFDDEQSSSGADQGYRRSRTTGPNRR